MAFWIIAGMTFREAARKKILWTALIAGLGFFWFLASACTTRCRISVADRFRRFYSTRS